MDSRCSTGVSLFNQGRFHAAHEVLEEIWTEAAPPEKKFWQGLVQLTVGFHHYSAGNLIGAASVLKRAGQNLALYPDDFCGFDVRSILISLEGWQEAFLKGSADQRDAHPTPPTVIFVHSRHDDDRNR